MIYWYLDIKVDGWNFLFLNGCFFFFFSFFV